MDHARDLFVCHLLICAVALHIEVTPHHLHGRSSVCVEIADDDTVCDI